MKHSKGYVLWEGPSPVDGAPIVAIATMRSKNPKTGPMVQIWIIRADVNPAEAVATGADRATCGDCALRPFLQRLARQGNALSAFRSMLRSKPCYVNVGQAPLGVWRAWRRGLYPTWSGGGAPFAGRAIRWGAYGDPALIPADVVHAVNAHARRWTGYTHQWRQPALQWARDVFMASADARADVDDARRRGWRVFFAHDGRAPMPGGMITCPASKEAGERTTCAECGLCNGARPGVKDIAILTH